MADPVGQGVSALAVDVVLSNDVERFVAVQSGPNIQFPFRQQPGAVTAPAGAILVEQPASPALFTVVGASAAILVANLYYAQPLITTIARSLGFRPELAGTIVCASQLGYGLGLLLLVPLSDMFENRRLVLTCGLLTLIGIGGMATARSQAAFLGFALITGIFASGAQMLIPYLSHLIPQEQRGRILGNVMAGVLAAIMLARPFALFVAAAFSWRAVFWASGAATVFLWLALWQMMPRRLPQARVSYSKTITSMFVLYASQPGVRRRTIYQAPLFAAFTMFWAVVPIVLVDRFALTKTQIGLFALAGAGGALAAPLAGRFADRGSIRTGTAAASLLIAASFLFSLWSFHVGMVLALAAASFLIDGSIQAVQTFSRLVVLGVAPEIRGRINALYMTILYTSGALGSVLGVSVYFHWGWPAVATLGAGAGFVVLVATLNEKSAGKPRRRSLKARLPHRAGPPGYTNVVAKNEHRGE